MKLIIKVLGGIEFDIQIDESSSVTELKSVISKKLHVSIEQQKIVFKGRTLSDEKSLSNYQIVDGAKLHVVLKKGSKSATESTPKLKQPKYAPGDFWKKLEEVLLKQYDDDTAYKIMHQFRIDYEKILTTMSLDDIERFATRNLSL